MTNLFSEEQRKIFISHLCLRGYKAFILQKATGETKDREPFSNTKKRQKQPVQELYMKSLFFILFILKKVYAKAALQHGQIYYIVPSRDATTNF